MRRKNQRGLTLIELIVAFTILSLLSTMALPLARYKIRRDHARKTVRRIQDAGINILGVVLNDIDFDGKDSYYYSYYYYQNRYYLSHYSQTDAETEAQKAKA